MDFLRLPGFLGFSRILATIWIPWIYWILGTFWIPWISTISWTWCILEFVELLYLNFCAKKYSIIYRFSYLPKKIKSNWLILTSFFFPGPLSHHLSEESRKNRNISSIYCCQVWYYQPKNHLPQSVWWMIGQAE